MIKSKVVVIGKETCKGCKILKENIESKQFQLNELNSEFNYISLDDLEDKDTFIQAHDLMGLPTTWIINTKGETINRYTGYVDADTIMDWLEEANE